MKTTFIITLIAHLSYIISETTFNIYFDGKHSTIKFIVNDEAKTPNTLIIQYGSKKKRVDRVIAYVDCYSIFCWKKKYCLDFGEFKPCWKESEEIVNEFAAFFGHKKVKYTILDTYLIYDMWKKPDHPREKEFERNMKHLKHLVVTKGDTEYLIFLESDN
jgi:hypothetical protein